MDIAARIGIKERVDAMVGGTTAAGFLHAKSGFDVNFLVRVIVVEVVDAGDEFPEHRRIGKVNLAARLTVGALRQLIVARVHGLELPAAAAQFGGPIVVS